MNRKLVRIDNITKMLFDQNFFYDNLEEIKIKDKIKESSLLSPFNLNSDYMRNMSNN